MAESSRTPSTTCVVLLVEDNEDTRLVYATYLRHYGFHVLEARDGVEGVELARRHLPHLILMDISLPRMDGWTATELLRTGADTRRIPIVAVTAHTMTTHRQKAEEIGFDGFLAKPCDPKRLLQEIQRLIATPARG